MAGMRYVIAARRGNPTAIPVVRSPRRRATCRRSPSWRKSIRGRWRPPGPGARRCRAFRRISRRTCARSTCAMGWPTSSAIGERGESRKTARPRSTAEDDGFRRSSPSSAETRLVSQTGWSDARALAQDAAAASVEGSCEGFFQWPEWSDTSPGSPMSSRRSPGIPTDGVSSSRRCPATREPAHGERGEQYLAGFLPLLQDGNARFMHPPRKTTSRSVLPRAREPQDSWTRCARAPAR